MPTYTIKPGEAAVFFDRATGARVLNPQRTPGEHICPDHLTVEILSGVEVDVEAVAAKAKAGLAASDAGMPRVVDDLIAVLIGKGVLTAADLPLWANVKLEARAAMRTELKR